MLNAEKNRDPERAKQRAVSDARCALRKLALLESMERWHHDYLTSMTQKNRAQGAALLAVLCEALGLGGDGR